MGTPILQFAPLCDSWYHGTWCESRTELAPTVMILQAKRANQLSSCPTVEPTQGQCVSSLALILSLFICFQGQLQGKTFSLCTYWPIASFSCGSDTLCVKPGKPDSCFQWLPATNGSLVLQVGFVVPHVAEQWPPT